MKTLLRRGAVLALLVAASPAATAAAQDCAPDPNTCVRFAAANYVGPTWQNQQGGVEVTLSRPGGGPAGSVIVRELEPGGDGWMAQNTWGQHNWGPATDGKVDFGQNQTTVTIKWYSSAPRSSPIEIHPITCETGCSPLPITEPRKACVESTQGQPAQRCVAAQPTCPGDPSCPPKPPTCPGDPSCPPDEQPVEDTTPPAIAKPGLADFSFDEVKQHLQCPETRSDCIGETDMASLVKLPVPPRKPKMARAAAVKRKLDFGRAAFRIEPGDTATVTIKFSAKVERALRYAFKRRRSIPVRIRVIMSDEFGNSTRKSFTARLKRPRKR